MSEDQARGVVEAHQFRGVQGMPLSDAQRLPGWGNLDKEMQERMLAIPPFTRSVSLHFSTGKFYDIQKTMKGDQYLVLDREFGTSGERVRVWVSEWICLMSDGSYIKLTDQQARMLGVQESPFVPPPARKPDGSY